MDTKHVKELMAIYKSIFIQIIFILSFSLVNITMLFYYNVTSQERYQVNICIHSPEDLRKQ